MIKISITSKPIFHTWVGAALLKLARFRNGHSGRDERYVYDHSTGHHRRIKVWQYTSELVWNYRLAVKIATWLKTREENTAADTLRASMRDALLTMATKSPLDGLNFDSVRYNEMLNDEKTISAIRYNDRKAEEQRQARVRAEIEEARTVVPEH